jgi:hypothetical protein
MVRTIVATAGCARFGTGLRTFVMKWVRQRCPRRCSDRPASSTGAIRRQENREGADFALPLVSGGRDSGYGATGMVQETGAVARMRLTRVRTRRGSRVTSGGLGSRVPSVPDGYLQDGSRWALRL